MHGNSTMTHCDMGNLLSIIMKIEEITRANSLGVGDMICIIINKYIYIIYMYIYIYILSKARWDYIYVHINYIYIYHWRGMLLGGSYLLRYVKMIRNQYYG
jgi:hypothetical protein